ncbi:hypothetical protein [Dactylosporangium sp. CS-033363]|uniref:hypothetical protein n=1 Tax=Dactylosporangium sp. CS-033363 TaxID=3239935 RepID=UPI003D93E044
MTQPTDPTRIARLRGPARTVEMRRAGLVPGMANAERMWDEIVDLHEGGMTMAKARIEVSRREQHKVQTEWAASADERTRLDEIKYNLRHEPLTDEQAEVLQTSGRDHTAGGDADWGLAVTVYVVAEQITIDGITIPEGVYMRQTEGKRSVTFRAPSLEAAEMYAHAVEAAYAAAIG